MNGVCSMWASRHISENEIHVNNLYCAGCSYLFFSSHSQTIDRSIEQFKYTHRTLYRQFIFSWQFDFSVPINGETHTHQHNNNNKLLTPILVNFVHYIERHTPLANWKSILLKIVYSLTARKMIVFVCSLI